MIMLFSVLILTGCGKAPLDECGPYAAHTRKDYGEPTRKIEFATKGTYAGGYVYYYPNQGFVKTFDTVVNEDKQEKSSCSEAWIITDKDKFINTCRNLANRFDCAGVILDQVGPLPFDN